MTNVPLFRKKALSLFFPILLHTTVLLRRTTSSRLIVASQTNSIIFSFGVESKREKSEYTSQSDTKFESIGGSFFFFWFFDCQRCGFTFDGTDTYDPNIHHTLKKTFSNTQSKTSYINHGKALKFGTHRQKDKSIVHHILCCPEFPVTLFSGDAHSLNKRPVDRRKRTAVSLFFTQFQLEIGNVSLRTDSTVVPSPICIF